MEPVTTTAVPSDRLYGDQVGAIVPVLNEADAIQGVVADLLANGVDLVVVVDGNSTDDTAERARAAGAHVIVETRRGYGRAMLTGIAGLPQDVGIVLFFDGDGSDRAEFAPRLIEAVRSRAADFAMGTRLAGERERGSLGVAQVVAGHLSGWLIWLLYGARFTDMSPFRALRRETLDALGMTDTTFGWNLEMQMRVAAARLPILELPVGQRRRVGGVSKVSGDFRVAIRAAWIIVRTFARLAVQLPRRSELPRRSVS